MKRITILLAALLSLVLLAATSDSTITVRPSDVKSGETKVLTDDGKKVTIRRDGDKVYVTIEGAGTRRVIVTDGDDGVRIEREIRRKVMKDVQKQMKDVQKQMKEQRFMMDDVVMPKIEIPKIEIPPIEIPKIEVPNVHPLIPHRTWFECPKDHTMLRVPEGKENETFKCPVDGTTMEKKKGSGWAYFYSDDESDDF